MLFSKLKEFDNTLQLITSNPSDPEITGISLLTELKVKHIVFIDNEAELAELVSSESSKYECAFVFNKELVKTSLESIKKIDCYCSMITSDVKQCHSLLSKAYYDLKFSELNTVVDGRVMGSASIHPSSWIAQQVFIGEDVVIGEDVKIHPGVVIMSNVEIGNNCEIFPNSTIYPFSKLKTNIRLHANTVVGVDCLDGRSKKSDKVWPLGGVIINNNVEIGSGVCIVSGLISPRIIEEDTYMNHHTQI